MDILTSALLILSLLASIFGSMQNEGEFYEKFQICSMVNDAYIYGIAEIYRQTERALK